MELFQVTQPINHLFIKLFAGKSGKVMMDNNGDRIADYWLWQLTPQADKFELWAQINMTRQSKPVYIKYIYIYI